MIDKIQKIREVIEKRYEYWKEKESNSHSIESEIRMSECQHLLLMLNSLQEEPVSEELEEAATKSANKATPYTRVDIGNGEVCVYTKHTVIDRFKGGAKWQRMQIDKDVNNLINVICNSCTPNAFGTLEQCIAAAQIEALKLIKED